MWDKKLKNQTIKKKLSRWMTVVCSFLLAVGLGFSVGSAAAEYFPESRETQAQTKAVQTKKVSVGGMPAGIYMETDGVLILDTQQIKGIDGKMYEPAQGMVKSGDYIKAVNQKEICGKKELLKELEKLSGEKVELTVRRGGKLVKIALQAVETAAGEYKLGIWVRDNVQGLGTVTFLTEQNEFGALGHGIHDTDTNGLMEISGGKLYRTTIQNVVKGSSGNPGTMEGMIVYNRYNLLGTIEKNTDAGIYGRLDKTEELFGKKELVETAAKEEIVTGPAKMRCFLEDEIREFDIEVMKVDQETAEINKGMMIRVTDEELLAAVKKRIGITGDYQDDTISGHIQDVKDYMADSGVSDAVMESDAILGAVTRGESDLWDYGSGSGEFSPYFFQRVTQLTYKGGEGI